MKKQTIVYEPHPVSAERKAELRAAGFTIVDAIYKPAEGAAEDPVELNPGAEKTDTGDSDEKPKDPGDEDEDPPVDPTKATSNNPADLTKKQLVEALKNLGVTAPDNANKATLVDLFNKAVA